MIFESLSPEHSLFGAFLVNKEVNDRKGNQMTDEQYMRRAIELAKRGMDIPRQTRWSEL